MIMTNVRSWLRAMARMVLSHTFMRTDDIRTIQWGPSRGLRYRIFPGYGISPVYGGWEPDVQRCLREYLVSGAVAYDVGANYGIHTLLLARLVGPSGHVYAFEPIDSIRERLMENVALNGFSNVTCVPVALDSSAGTQTFITGHHAGAGHFVGVGSGYTAGVLVSVSTATIDDLVFSQEYRAPDLIKIDVEGAESNVLLGARKVLEKVRPVVILELHTPEEDVAVGRILLEHGYSALRVGTGETVKDLTKGWPHREGMWGHILALPSPIKQR